ncbi:hypothetical protein CGC20_18800 [Leishmania donovani]|uniref:Uncharacterized protein n=1 Tax=Leishmania donovani TaxID=5661 RepID=A0A504XLS6_LEIDO|nr:hypothetical protein CGC20_18800 [Leishmania donovani]
MSLSNKREVREHVKLVLQPYEENSHIDVEDMKVLTREASDAVATLPATPATVATAALTALQSLLSSRADVKPEVLEAVARALEASSVTAEQATASAASSHESGTATQGMASGSGTSSTAPNATTLSFSAFKARMAKKRDELKAERDTVAEVTSTATTHVESTTAAPPADSSPKVKKEEVPTTTVGTDPTESRNLSNQPSAAPTPSLRPSTAPAPSSIPDLAEEAALSRERDDVSSEQPPAKVEKKETFLFSALPDPDEDLTMEE